MYQVYAVAPNNELRDTKIKVPTVDRYELAVCVLDTDNKADHVLLWDLTGGCAHERVRRGDRHYLQGAAKLDEEEDITCPVHDVCHHTYCTEDYCHAVGERNEYLDGEIEPDYPEPTWDNRVI